MRSLEPRSHIFMERITFSIVLSTPGPFQVQEDAAKQDKTTTARDPTPTPGTRAQAHLLPAAPPRPPPELLCLKTLCSLLGRHLCS